MTEFQKTFTDLVVDGTDLRIAALRRNGHRAPVVFMHGFGSTKEDYADITLQSAFDDRPFLSWDAPGCGETVCSDLAAISIPFQIKTALALIDGLGFDRFHLVGHSMGGLGALLLAHDNPGRVLSFTDIEGNIAPEDCFLSRQIVAHANPDPEAFFDDFIERTRHAQAWSSAIYAAGMRHKVRAGSIRGIFSSMVHLSDNGGLMDKFLDLPTPRMFMYGEQNKGLSYLPHIASQGVRLCEVPECGHFPMYSNPPFMWRALADFIGVD
jgi:pimeloyl-ACP methyl ester carboxylesterase